MERVGYDSMPAELMARAVLLMLYRRVPPPFWVVSRKCRHRDAKLGGIRSRTRAAVSVGVELMRETARRRGSGGVPRNAGCQTGKRDRVWHMQEATPQTDWGGGGGGGGGVTSGGAEGVRLLLLSSSPSHNQCNLGSHPVSSHFNDACSLQDVFKVDSLFVQVAKQSNNSFDPSHLTPPLISIVTSGHL